MQRTEIARIFADMEHYGGQEVTVCGWVRTIRDMKNFGFIELNDGSCFKSVQVVFDGALENYKEIAKQNVGAALIVKGNVVLTPDAKQPLEVKAVSIAVEGPSAPEYPLQKKRHGVEFLRTVAHRVQLTAKAETGGVTVDEVLQRILESVNAPKML